MVALLVGFFKATFLIFSIFHIITGGQGPGKDRIDKWVKPKKQKKKKKDRDGAQWQSTCLYGLAPSSSATNERQMKDKDVSMLTKHVSILAHPSYWEVQVPRQNAKTIFMGNSLSTVDFLIASPKSLALCFFLGIRINFHQIAGRQEFHKSLGTCGLGSMNPNNFYDSTPLP